MPLEDRGYFRGDHPPACTCVACFEDRRRQVMRSGGQAPVQNRKPAQNKPRPASKPKVAARAAGSSGGGFTAALLGGLLLIAIMAGVGYFGYTQFQSGGPSVPIAGITYATPTPVPTPAPTPAPEVIIVPTLIPAAVSSALPAANTEPAPVQQPMDDAQIAFDSAAENPFTNPAYASMTPEESLAEFNRIIDVNTRHPIQEGGITLDEILQLAEATGVPWCDALEIMTNGMPCGGYDPKVHPMDIPMPAPEPTAVATPTVDGPPYEAVHYTRKPINAPHPPEVEAQVIEIVRTVPVEIQEQFWLITNGTFSQPEVIAAGKELNLTECQAMTLWSGDVCGVRPGYPTPTQPPVGNLNARTGEKFHGADVINPVTLVQIIIRDTILAEADYLGYDLAIKGFTIDSEERRFNVSYTQNLHRYYYYARMKTAYGTISLRFTDPAEFQDFRETKNAICNLDEIDNIKYISFTNCHVPGGRGS